MSDTREDLLANTARVVGRSTRVLDPMRLQVWERMGIGLPQLRILFRVRYQPGIDLRTLAAELNISPSAASQQVDKLVERGLLDRQPAHDDRRRLSLDLTDDGLDATRAISQATIDYLHEVLATFGDDDLAELHRLLARLVEVAATVPLPPSFQAESGDALESAQRV